MKLARGHPPVKTSAHQAGSGETHPAHLQSPKRNRHTECQKCQILPWVLGERVLTLAGLQVGVRWHCPPSCSQCYSGFRHPVSGGSPGLSRAPLGSQAQTWALAAAHYYQPSVAPPLVEDYICSLQSILTALCMHMERPGVGGTGWGEQ